MPTTLSKVGNSMAVLLPKALRHKAQIDTSAPIELHSPRKGVIVITAMDDTSCDRLAKLDAIEAKLAELSKSLPPWPEGKDAEGLIREGKEARADEIALL